MFTLGGILPLLTAFILLPWYTRLPTADFGQFALYSGLYILMQTLVNFGVDSVVGVQYVEYHDDSQSLDAAMSGMGGLMLSLGAGALLLAVALTLILPQDGFLPWNQFAVASVASAFFYSFTKTYSNVLINQQRPVAYLLLAAVNFISVMGVTLVFFHAVGNTLAAPIWGRTVGLALSFCIVALAYGRRYGFRWDSSQNRLWLALLAPMVLYNFMGWALRYTDRFVLQGALGPEVVGRYDYAFKLAMVLEFVQIGLYNTFNPKVFHSFRDRGFLNSRSLLNATFHRYTALVVLVIPGLYALLVGLVPKFMPRPEYASAYIWVGPLLWTFALRGLYNTYLSPLYFFKETTLFPKYYAWSVGLYVPILIALVAFFGANGAVASVAAVSILQLISVHRVTRAKYPMTYNVWKMIGLPVFGALNYSIWVALDLDWLATASLMMVSNMLAVLTVFWREIRSLK